MDEDGVLRELKQTVTDSLKQRVVTIQRLVFFLQTLTLPHDDVVQSCRLKQWKPARGARHVGQILNMYDFHPICVDG